MKNLSVSERVKLLLDPKCPGLRARLFLTREDGITVYDTVQDPTTNSVAALVSGVWQASEALMGIVRTQSDGMEFRLGFDTSSEGVILFPVELEGKRYFLGAIFRDCLSPGQLKRKLSLIKTEMENLFPRLASVKKQSPSIGRDGYLFQDISDEEIDRLFGVRGV